MKTAAHICDKLSRQAGGMFESVRGLARGMDGHDGWRSCVVGLEDSDTPEDMPAWEGLETHVLPRAIPGPVGGANAIARRLKEISPDVVHLHGLWGPSSKAAHCLLRAKDRPAIVISPRGMLEPWAMRRSRLKKWLAWKVWVGELVRRADCLHALCEEEKESMLSLLPGARIAVVPNGVTLPDIDQHVQRDRNVLFLGRLHPKKGLEPLLEAWASLRPCLEPDWTLTVAGWDDGGHEARLRTRTEALGLADSVVFAGPVFGNNKAGLLRRASAFVLPSLSEGLPMAVLEAWSYGLPVLMTDECHLREGFAANAAVRATPHSASLAAGLAELLIKMNVADRADMGARGRALVAGKFTWPRIGEDMAAVYQSLC